MAPGDQGPILLYDGSCGLCQRAVRFILAREAAPVLRFASLQSRVATELLAPFGIALPPEPDTLWLIDGGRLFGHSSGALRIARGLRWPWRALAWLWIVPRPVRDAVYRWVAARRYRWFGRDETCARPAPDQAARFLDG